MTRATRNALFQIVVILGLGGLMAWIGSHGSAVFLGAPLFAVCAALSFGINWIVFVPSYLAQTEHYFDLTGTLSYLSLVGLALIGRPETDPRAWLLAVMIAAWAIRLGAFLFRRVREDGSDGRFDSLKPHFTRFLMTWTLQGLWVFLTVSCALAAMTSAETVPFGWLGAVGIVLWGIGFAIETVADQQKRVFRSNPAHRDRFISHGLWAWSRHPNYFGEILLWVGIAIVALPALSGWRYVALISPVFVFVLLTRISGVPLLENRANRKWGENPDYREYCARTPVLVLRPPAGAERSGTRAA